MQQADLDLDQTNPTSYTYTESRHTTRLQNLALGEFEKLLNTTYCYFYDYYAKGS
jgi:hypothetical protein